MALVDYKVSLHHKKITLLVFPGKPKSLVAKGVGPIN